jgi:uncharacterized membrane protein
LLLRAKLLKLQTETSTPVPATGTTPVAATVDSVAVKEQVNTLQNAFNVQEKVWKEEERAREYVETQQHVMQSKYEVIITQTNNVRGHTEKMKKAYESTQKKLKKEADVSTKKAEDR